MVIVGVRELKNRLTHYLSITRRGVPVIVTDRNEPIAVLHGLDQVEETAGTEERLASLAHLKRLRMPTDLSALNRKHKAKDFPRRVLGELIEAFESDWRKLFVLEFDDELLPAVKSAVLKHSVRGADAVHLASATWLRSVLKEDVVFACADAKLLAAARAERLLPFEPGRGTL